MRDTLAFKYLPTSRFKTVILNKKIPPFDQVQCRREFAKELRKTYSSFDHRKYKVSGSIFPNILPGYRDDEEMALEIKDSSSLACKWSDYMIPMVSIHNPIAEFDTIAIIKTLLRLGAGISMQPSVSNFDELGQAVDNNKTAFDFFRSGFWAQDVIGDTQMIFTPDMHKPLRYVNQNEELRAALNRLDSIEANQLDQAMASVNLALFKDSVMVTVLHSKNFYAANKIELIAELPQSVVHPAPWQIFNLDENRK